MARDTFGIQGPGVSGTEDGQDMTFLDPAADQPAAQLQTQETPQQAQEPERPEDAVPGLIPGGPDTPVETPEPSDAEPVPVATPEDQPVERLWANKYKDPEAMEKGYREQSDLQRRTAQARRAAETQAAELAQRNQMLEDTLKRAMPILQAASAARQQYQRQQQGADPWAEPQSQPQQLDPRYVDQIVQQRLGEYQQQMQQQYEQQTAHSEAESSIMGFYGNHPEVEVRGELDGKITQAVTDLQQAFSEQGYDFDIGDPDMLEIAYETVKDPALKQVLEINPQLHMTDAGLQLARKQAETLRPPAATQQQTVTGTNPAPVVGQRKPVTESASQGGAAQSGDKPLNEFQEAVQALRRNAAGGLGGSVFG